MVDSPETPPSNAQSPETISLPMLPICVKWNAIIPKYGTSAANQGGSCYLQPLEKVNDRTPMIMYDSGTPSCVSSIKSTLEANNAYLKGIIISHFDNDHVGGFQKMLEKADGILDTVEFLVLPVLPKTHILQPVLESHLVKATDAQTRIMKSTNNRVCVSTKKAFSYYTVTPQVLKSWKDKKINPGGDNESSIMIGYAGNYHIGDDPTKYYLFTGDSDAEDVMSGHHNILSTLSKVNGQAEPPKTWDMMEQPHHGSIDSCTTDLTENSKLNGDSTPAAIQNMREKILSISKGYFITCPGSIYHPNPVLLRAIREEKAEKFAKIFSLNKPVKYLPLVWLGFPSLMRTLEEGVIDGIYQFQDFIEEKYVRIMFENNSGYDAGLSNKSVMDSGNSYSAVQYPSIQIEDAKIVYDEQKGDIKKMDEYTLNGPDKDVSELYHKQQRLKDMKSVSDSRYKHYEDAIKNGACFSVKGIRCFFIMLGYRVEDEKFNQELEKYQNISKNANKSIYEYLTATGVLENVTSFAKALENVKSHTETLENGTTSFAKALENVKSHTETLENGTTSLVGTLDNVKSLARILEKGTISLVEALENVTSLARKLENVKCLTVTLENVKSLTVTLENVKSLARKLENVTTLLAKDSDDNRSLLGTFETVARKFEELTRSSVNTVKSFAEKALQDSRKDRDNQAKIKQPIENNNPKWTTSIQSGITSLRQFLKRDACDYTIIDEINELFYTRHFIIMDESPTDVETWYMERKKIEEYNLQKVQGDIRCYEIIAVHQKQLQKNLRDVKKEIDRGINESKEYVCKYKWMKKLERYITTTKALQENCSMFRDVTPMAAVNRMIHDNNEMSKLLESTKLTPSNEISKTFEQTESVVLATETP